jgi:hypothetical protein
MVSCLAADQHQDEDTRTSAFPPLSLSTASHTHTHTQDRETETLFLLSFKWTAAAAAASVLDGGLIHPITVPQMTASQKICRQENRLPIHPGMKVRGKKVLLVCGSGYMGEAIGGIVRRDLR